MLGSIMGPLIYGNPNCFKSANLFEERGLTCLGTTSPDDRCYSCIIPTVIIAVI